MVGAGFTNTITRLFRRASEAFDGCGRSQQQRASAVSSVEIETTIPITHGQGTDAVLVWRDPPADRRRSVFTPVVIEALRARPGRWAVVREYPNLTAIKRGHKLKHPADIELRAVAEPPGSVLYARAKPS
jgi:hypothetical protein